MIYWVTGTIASSIRNYRLEMKSPSLTTKDYVGFPWVLVSSPKTSEECLRVNSRNGSLMFNIGKRCHVVVILQPGKNLGRWQLTCSNSLGN